MKNKNIKSLAVVFLALMFTSCVKDLDVTPRDPNIITSLTVYSTPAAYKEGLAKLYATFSVSGQQGPSGQPDIAGIQQAGPVSPTERERESGPDLSRRD